INDYHFAVSQLAQTTMRSEIGKLDLDRTFEERMAINRAVVQAIDEAAISWGVKVLRYEIKNITPPQSVLSAMEKQMQAERGGGAVILQADGVEHAAIKGGEGHEQEVVLESEARRGRHVQDAAGEAAARSSVAEARAHSVRLEAEPINTQ